MRDDFLVSEIFNSIQGEGPDLGRPALFIRLFGCNLRCTYCDTKHTWKLDGPVPDPKAKLRRVSIKDMAHKVTESCPQSSFLGSYLPQRPIHHCGKCSKLIVVTGGEPMLQADKILYLAAKCKNWDIQFSIETAGTIWHDQLSSTHNIQFVVAPKLENSGNPTSLTYKDELLKYANHRFTTFKFVVRDTTDLDEVSDIVRSSFIPSFKVFIVPEGIETDKIQKHLRLVADKSIALGFNVTTRLHVQIWGNTRGV